MASSPAGEDRASGPSPLAVLDLHRQHHPGYEEGALRSRQIRTARVAVLTLVTMVVEIAVGSISGSLALMADGWHMATHAGAFALATGAYWLARRSSRPSSHSAARICAAAGVINALAVGLAAVFMLLEAGQRLREPALVHYGQALPVAVLGLLVNVVSLRLLHVAEHEHHDHNLRGAHLHVTSDVLTSVLALVALGAGLLTGVTWPDSLSASIGAVVILVWAGRLARDSLRTIVGRPA